MRIGLNLALAAAVALAVPLTVARAQTPPDLKSFTSSAEVTAMIAKAKATRKPDEPTVLQPLLQLPPYRANLEYRAAIGPAAVHEDQAELFYVVEGGGTLVTGGKLTDEKRTNATNLSGSGIAGGNARHVAKGDFWIVPQNTPHWFSAIDGTLVLMSIHVPRTTP
jgi:mannose-6-phosphate isomerase-like protein (cupin superfamily)